MILTVVLRSCQCSIPPSKEVSVSLSSVVLKNPATGDMASSCPVSSVLGKLEQSATMKHDHRPKNLIRVCRNLFRRSAPTHDPLLFFNMALFNFADGWARILLRYGSRRFPD